jgi:hypothetical protein
MPTQLCTTQRSIFARRLPFGKNCTTSRRTGRSWHSNEERRAITFARTEPDLATQVALAKKGCSPRHHVPPALRKLSRRRKRDVSLYDSGRWVVPACAVARHLSLARVARSNRMSDCCRNSPRRRCYRPISKCCSTAQRPSLFSKPLMDCLSARRSGAAMLRA